MTQEQKIVRIDGIKWWVSTLQTGTRVPIPLCPEHDLRLDPRPERVFNETRGFENKERWTAKKLECAEGPHIISIPREFQEEKNYVINRIDALVFKKMVVLNLDDEAIPVASTIIRKNSPYWVKAKVTESKSGIRLIVWAGDKSKKNKTQLFIEPELKRLSFDQNDDHPTEIFAKVVATFSENQVTTIEKQAG